jgi:hypothetical protein
MDAERGLWTLRRYPYPGKECGGSWTGGTQVEPSEYSTASTDEVRSIVSDTLEFLAKT